VLNAEFLIRDRLNKISADWGIDTGFTVSPDSVKHLGIICDGNRRAAQEWGVPAFLGHRVGVEVIKGISRASRDWGIKALTFWVWSTENWNRDNEQVAFVMQLAEEFLPQKELLDELTENRVRFTHLGRKDRLPPTLTRTLQKLEESTRDFDNYYLNLALDYGGLNEMARGVRRIFDQFIMGKFDPNILDRREEVIYEFLDTSGQPLPDLVIRTGVRKREIPHTSGFMPLQTAYSGWIFLPDLFPNLTPERLIASIRDFEGYKRRFGQ